MKSGYLHKAATYIAIAGAALGLTAAEPLFKDSDADAFQVVKTSTQTVKGKQNKDIDAKVDIAAIERGDTFSKIAKEYNTSWQNICGYISKVTGVPFDGVFNKSFNGAIYAKKDGTLVPLPYKEISGEKYFMGSMSKADLEKAVEKAGYKIKYTTIKGVKLAEIGKEGSEQTPSDLLLNGPLLIKKGLISDFSTQRLRVGLDYSLQDEGGVGVEAELANSVASYKNLKLFAFLKGMVKGITSNGKDRETPHTTMIGDGPVLTEQYSSENESKENGRLIAGAAANLNVTKDLSLEAKIGAGFLFREKKETATNNVSYSDGQRLSLSDPSSSKGDDNFVVEGGIAAALKMIKNWSVGVEATVDNKDNQRISIFTGYEW